MRITNKMITKSYTRQINTLSVDLNKLNNQITTGRRFSKSSEDTAAAVKAYEIRRNMSKVEDYQDNIGHAKDFLSNTETTLSLVQGSVQNALDKIRYGLNGSQSQDERTIVAQELKTIQDEMLQTLNSNSTGNYMFGGTNGVDRPFVVNTAGDLTYNGQVLKDLDSSVPADAAIIK
ncbi:MAG TPA: flagellar hook-associated protein FlgL, partial [Anaerovoracaceae bacterium]|nr:flagellar hook-associated protein FlgL [Anaerovoracaceae bacterium]